jgi:IS5 family transposase
MEALVGNIIARILANKGYRGRNAPPDYKFRVFISGQKRGVTPGIKRERRRRSAVGPVIGHLKAEHRMGRNYLFHRRGDAANAVLAAAGCNFRRLIRWLSLLLRQIFIALNASAVTSWFKRRSSHAGLLFVNQIGSILRVGMLRNRPFAGSC